MNGQLIKKVETFAKSYCKDKVIEFNYEDQKLWENHVQLVRKYALELAKTEGGDKDVVEIAALLHDVGKYKGREGHDVRSYRLSKDFLRKLNIPQKERDLILKCIAKHSSRFSQEENEIEVKIIQSADALGLLFDEEWQDYCRSALPKEKLLILYEKSFRKINLDSARKIGKPQVEKLRRLTF